MLTLHIRDDYMTVPPFTFTHLSEASQHYRTYVDDNGYGARDVNDGLITYQNRIIARISYNGKVWRNWTGPEQLLYDPWAEAETLNRKAQK